MKIIGITGTIGAGKGEAVAYLTRKGFRHFSAREFLKRKVEERGLSLTRDSFASVANDLRFKHGTAYVIESLYTEAALSGEDSVIESIRTPGEIEFLKAQPGFILLAIDADREVRFDRIRSRGSETDHVSFEKFVSDEEREMTSADPAGQNISACIRLADIVIRNDATRGEFHARLDEALQEGRLK